MSHPSDSVPGRNNESDEIKKHLAFCRNHVFGFQFCVPFFFSQFKQPYDSSLFSTCWSPYKHFLISSLQWPHTINSCNPHFVDEETETQGSEAPCLDGNPSWSNVRAQLLITRPCCSPANCPDLYFLYNGIGA